MSHSCQDYNHNATHLTLPNPLGYNGFKEYHVIANELATPTTPPDPLRAPGRPRRTIAEARAARLERYLVKTRPVYGQTPKQDELGPYTRTQWAKQLWNQYHRCYDCNKPNARLRRFRAAPDGFLRCQKCWWGKGYAS